MMNQEQKVMVIIRDELYGGSWDDMEKDLKERRGGKPEVQKLFKKIDRDLAMISHLREAENNSGVKFSQPSL